MRSSSIYLLWFPARHVSLQIHKVPTALHLNCRKFFPDFSLIAFSQSSDRNCRLHLFLFRQDGDKNQGSYIMPALPPRNAFPMFQSLKANFLQTYTSQDFMCLCLHFIDCIVSLCATSCWRISFRASEQMSMWAPTCGTPMWVPCRGKINHIYACMGLKHTPRKYANNFMCCCILKFVQIKINRTWFSCIVLNL